MPQYYQSKRLVDCQLPRDIFKRVSSMLEGYPRMKTEMAGLRMNIIMASPKHDGQPKGPGVGDPTANKAMRLAKLGDELEAIEGAVRDVNAIYTSRLKRDDISSFDAVSAFGDYRYYCFAMYDPDSGKQPARRTWSYFKTLLAYKLAENLNLI